MPIISRSPAYNLKVVLNETGLKADVLRAWERRYGLPIPQRTPGGHRLYSEYDIETVKWLRARQAEGLSISRAVDLWKEITGAGLDPLVEYSQAAVASIPELMPVADTRLENLRQEWLEAVLAFDSLKSDEVLNQAFAMYPIETVCMEILQQGLSEMGNQWYLDEASVQQEHFASALASRRLETLISATPRPTRRLTILTGCPPVERHTFPVLLLSLFLRRRGLAVVYLGADVPIERLEETAGSVRPDLIIMAAQHLSTAATLQSVALFLKTKGHALAYGGLIFNRIPRLRERIPGYFLGETLGEAVHMVERLLVAPTSLSFENNIDKAHQELGRLFSLKRPLIEAAVFGEMHQFDLQSQYIGDANYFFGNGLSAALELGDPAYLEADVDWVKKLLIRRQVPAEVLVPYLSAYSQSVHKELGEAAAPINDWIGSYIAQHASNHR